MPEKPKLTLAERQANWRRNREAREQIKDDALRRIRTDARTIREARKIAGEALGEEE